MYLDAGYDPDSFWALSPAEVGDCIEASARRWQRKLEERRAMEKDLIYMLYVHAQQVVNTLGPGLSKDTELLPLYKWYPDLFEEQEKKQEDIELLQYQAQMENYAIAFNRRFTEQEKQKGGEEDGDRIDTGETESDH